MKFHYSFSKLLLLLACIISKGAIEAQQTKSLPLLAAIQSGLNNYPSIQAKKNYLRASEEQIKNTQNEYLPNIIASFQQDYGTINGQFGPLSGYGAGGTTSSGPTSNNQNWSAAFGGVYILNTNWEAFSFGRLKSRIDYAATQIDKDSADVVQEQFIQSIKISAAYLNLLVTQIIKKTAIANLERAKYVQQVVIAEPKMV